jgi:transcriptional regulator
MHPNPSYRQPSDDQHRAFAQNRAFGTLCINAPDGPLLAHVPFALDDSGKTAHLHLVRSNPILRSLDQPVPAVIAIAGADGYVSPDWYKVDDQVPTWNYVAVHLRGTLQRLPQPEMRAMLDMQSAIYEGRLRPKTPWTTAKMTPEILEKMMRQIVPCRLSITAIDGTWKLSQNKPDAVRMRTAGAIQSGIGSELEQLAALMRNPPSA